MKGDYCIGVVIPARNEELFIQEVVESLPGYVDAIVTWNFQKFLIDENGYVVKSISPRRKPDDQEVLNWINGS